ncbi:MAG: hypothetical protein KDN22_34160, partial [Verrucomicrobiae bacterium]|nr:hypothetical protein [Verrucomicrobiae bacterium]
YFPFNAGIDDELSEAFLLELTDALDDDPEAQSVVAAIWEGASKRSSIAEATGFSVDQVTKVKKRLQRRLKEFRGKFLDKHGIRD